MDVGRLKTIPLFESVPEDCLRRIDAFVKEASVSPGTELVKEGEYAYELMAIEEGTAEVRHGDERLAELAAGDFFGETGVMQRAQRNASVIATSPLTAIVITGHEFRQLAREMPAIAATVKEECERRAEAVLAQAGA